MGGPRLASVSTLMRKQVPPSQGLEEGLALAALEAELFERPTSAVPVLARYVLAEKIGTGGLGVVFRAYDPDLDRRVALKLMRLHPDAADPERSVLLREARVLARLSHPNVVTVHDVGTYSEQDLGQVANHQDLGIPTRGVFMVMELLERGSLHELLRKGLPPRRIMTILLDAGRGVAAAHDQGIVHRDFKPGNVLVGTDGEVRVADFGLALSVAEPDGEPGSGTPAYMAPEQRGGGEADARSDQYAFALTCWVALYGFHPFAGTHAPGKIRGPLPAAPRRHGVPRSVHRVLRRALSLDPSRRYPDVPAMLRALASAASHRTRRRLVVVGGVAIAGLAGAQALLDEPTPVCASAGSAIDQVWSDTERAALAEAFVATEQPFARDSWQSVRRTLDAYAEQWRAASHTACEDTHVRHVQSEALLDLRTECLERHRRELGAAIDLLRDTDPAMLANTVEVVHGLGWIAACEDPEVVAARRRLPKDAGQREAIEQLSLRLGEARLLELSGRYIEAMALADWARQEAERLHDEPLEAAAALRQGSVAASRGDHQRSRGLLLRGIQLAEGARQDELAADGWIRLLWVEGVELEDTAQGDIWVGFASAALRRLGDDPLREAALVHNLGGLYYRRGDWDQALIHYERALEVQRTRLGDDDPRVARTLNHIANVLLMAEQPRRSLSYSQRSLEVRRELLGPLHPLVAASLNNIAAAHLALSAHAEAAAAIDQSLEITSHTDLPEEAVARRLAHSLQQAQQETDGP